MEDIEKRMLSKAGSIRGEFITQVAFIEKQIELFIAYHFCKDIGKANEMIEVLTGDRFVSFESKRGAFESLMKRHYPSEYKNGKKMFENLTVIQNERNKLAHLIQYLGEDAEKRFEKDGAIALVKIVYDKTQAVWYDKAKLDSLSKVINEIREWLPPLVNNEAPS